MGHNSLGGGNFIFGICQSLKNYFKMEKKANFVSGHLVFMAPIILKWKKG